MAQTHRGIAAVSTLVGLASLSALAIAGWSFNSGASVCSLLGVCASGATATTLVSDAQPDAKAEQPAQAASQCSACAKAANGVCAKCAAKAQAEGAKAVVAAAIEPAGKAKAVVGANVINATCPGSGKAVAEGVTATYAGLQVGFCCEKCKAHFDASASAEQALVVAKILAARPVNATCPGMSAPVSAAHTLSVAGTTVGFASDQCKAAFAAKPYEAQIAYVASQVGADVINEVCGTCHQPVSADAGQVIFAGQRIGFGCAGCKPKFEAMSQDQKIAYLATLLEARQAKLAQTACTDATCTKDNPCAACKAKMNAKSTKADASDAD